MIEIIIIIIIKIYYLTVQFPITRLPVHVPEESCDVNPESEISIKLDKYQIFSV
jgi:hypothetical protein